jgi:hypothetical protein
VLRSRSCLTVLYTGAGAAGALLVDATAASCSATAAALSAVNTAGATSRYQQGRQNQQTTDKAWSEATAAAIAPTESKQKVPAADHRTFSLLGTTSLCVYNAIEAAWCSCLCGSRAGRRPTCYCTANASRCMGL